MSLRCQKTERERTTAQPAQDAWRGEAACWTDARPTDSRLCLRLCAGRCAGLRVAGLEMVGEAGVAPTIATTRGARGKSQSVALIELSHDGPHPVCASRCDWSRAESHLVHRIEIT